MREYWAEKGGSECQNADTNFNASGVVFGTKNFTRHCSLSYFTRIHTLTGAKIQRSCLCYSISKKRLFCTPENLESDLADELIQFVSFVKSAEGQQALIISPNEPEVKYSNELHMYLLLTELSLDQTFPNVYIMFRIYLCMMITNCEGKRSTQTDI